VLLVELQNLCESVKVTTDTTTDMKSVVVSFLDAQRRRNARKKIQSLQEFSMMRLEVQPVVLTYRGVPYTQGK